jgi:EpsI family protein
MQDKIIVTLDLDDYLYQNYSNGKQSLSLYIGYYLTGGKLGAAHDPLVCLPGQGWFVRKRGNGDLDLDDTGTHNISYATILVERNGEQELFLYWFQAYDKAVSGTFSQKFISLINKVQGLGQDNAFVRISCSMNGRTEQQCKQILLNFVKEFYPKFLAYIRDDNVKSF